jgi:hypothetical protein
MPAQISLRIPFTSRARSAKRKLTECTLYHPENGVSASAECHCPQRHMADKGESQAHRKLRAVVEVIAAQLKFSSPGRWTNHDNRAAFLVNLSAIDGCAADACA